MNWWNTLKAWIIKQVFLPQESILTSKPMPQIPAQILPPQHPLSLLDTFCEAIKFREGANPAINNPGNCKYYYGGYLPLYGDVKRSQGGFAIFSTYELGWLYLENLVKEIIKTHPTLTFYTFFAGDGEWKGYSPANDGNDPVSYSNQVAGKVGLPVNSLVAQILPA